MKTAVLIHGHHLGAGAWENAVWGDPSHGILGCIPKGLLEAKIWNADIIFFPTGASELDGLKEGEWALKLAHERIAQLSEFDAPDGNAQEWLNQRAILELTSTNTRSEIETCAAIALERDISRLILVSNPTHIMRCHQTALSLFDTNAKLRPLKRNLYTTASDVPYAGRTVDDVVIVEPPHRPDRPKVFFNETLKVINSIRKTDRAAACNEDLKIVLKKYL